jgi:hypothetical protein
MLHVSIGANGQIIFVASSTNLHTNMLSVSIGAHKYAACFYWRPPSSYLCAQQHKFRQKYGEPSYWGEQQHGFA